MATIEKRKSGDGFVYRAKVRAKLARQKQTENTKSLIDI